jgi:ubiquinone/menaquinone biosynthesis C-methylase UbiE
MELTLRQQRERDYHAELARERTHKRTEAVPMAVVADERRRWWNAYWHTYSHVRQLDVAGKRVMVAGCGFGDDAIRLAACGAAVSAFDISPDIIEIARDRGAHLAEGFRGGTVEFDVMPAERLAYPSDFFDIAFFVDILHHVDIPQAVAELRRVVKPGGTIVGDELYTHSAIERIRRSALVGRVLYPRMVKFIYGTATPYITVDEHKIDEAEFAVLRGALAADARIDYYNLFTNRLVPERYVRLAKIDRTLLTLLAPLGRLLAGRVVFAGRVRKPGTGGA